MLKKVVLAIVLLLVTTNGWAIKTYNVSAGPHNMGMLNTNPTAVFLSTDEDEVCIFCHTPHGGSLNGPLWNRNLPNQAGVNFFGHYTSATLSTYMKGLSTTRVVRNESLLCMSCHDGQVAFNNIINPSNRTGGLPPTMPGGADVMWDTSFGADGSDVIGDPNAVAPQNFLVGRNLTNDHPISFQYTPDQTANSGKLRDTALAKGSGIRFFGNQTTENYVECSSCHDPHIDYSDPVAGGTGDVNYAPFLVTPNAGSNLCLACHIK